MRNITFVSNNYQGGIAIYNGRLAAYINDSSLYTAKTVLYNQYPDQFSGTRVIIKKHANKIASYGKLRSVLIGDVICCSESIELETLNYYKFEGQIIYFLHGDYPYYLNTAKKFESIIDSFACVSELIEEKLCNLLPHRRNSIRTIKAIIPNSYQQSNKNGLIFVGRAEEAKGFNYILTIYDQLKAKGHKIPLSIYCQEKTLLSQNAKRNHPEVRIEYGKSNSFIMRSLAQASYLIFPSQYEGLPLVVAEAMQHGVIPITSDLPILKIMTNNCGFNFKYNDVPSFVNTIIELEGNLALRNKLSNNSKERVKALFNSEQAFSNFEELASLQEEKQFLQYKKFCSRLDHPYIPNWVTLLLRISKKSLKLIISS